MKTQATPSLRIVHTEASCGWGGQEIRILTEASGMIGRGHEVTIAAPAHAPIYAEAKRRDVPVVALPIDRKNIKGLLALRAWIQRSDPDVINTHSSTDSWLAALACKTLRRAPAVVRTRHISAPVSINWSTRWLYTRGSTHVVTTGERLRETLIRQNGFPPAAITSVPTGIDPDVFKPGDRDEARRKLGLPLDRTIVGIVATFRSWKGHTDLVEAVGRIGDEKLLVAFVGDGPYRPSIEVAIDRFGIRAQTLLPGNQDDVVPWLQAFDVFVLPSRANEGVPQGILQAMMCARPVISTPIGSIGEAVLDHRTGLMVPPGDVTALSTAISALTTDPQLARRLAEQGRAHVLANFSSGKMLDDMEAIFQRAAQFGKAG